MGIKWLHRQTDFISGNKIRNCTTDDPTEIAFIPYSGIATEKINRVLSKQKIKTIKGDVISRTVITHKKRQLFNRRSIVAMKWQCLPIIEALKKFRCYLLGAKFKIFTEFAAFQKNISKKDLTMKVARWILQREEFDYEILRRSVAIQY